MPQRSVSAHPAFGAWPARSYATTGGKFTLPKANNYNGYTYPYPWDDTPSVANPAWPPTKLARIPNRIFLVGEEWDNMPVLGQIAAPTRMVVGQSTDYTLEGHYAGWNGTTKTYQPCHKRGATQGGNYGYSDGHVEFHIVNDFQVTGAAANTFYGPSTDYQGDAKDPWKFYPSNGKF